MATTTIDASEAREPRPEKVAVVQEVRDRFAASDAVMLTEYRGLKVSEIAELRRSLKKVGGDYKIYKNTLVRRAVSDLGVDGVDELLVGPTALAFIDGDAVGVAKALRDYAKGNPSLVLKGGILGDKFLTADDVKTLADIAPREVLLARLAGGMAAPMQQFAGLLQALPRNFAYGLKALIDQGGAPGTPASEDVPAEDVPAEEEVTPVAEAAEAAEVSTPEAAPAAEDISTESPEEA